MFTSELQKSDKKLAGRLFGDWVRLLYFPLFALNTDFLLTVESPLSHTPLSHTYPLSHTLFGLTKM